MSKSVLVRVEGYAGNTHAADGHGVCVHAHDGDVNRRRCPGQGRSYICTCRCIWPVPQNTNLVRKSNFVTIYDASSMAECTSL